MKLTLEEKILAAVILVVAVLVFGWCQRREGKAIGQVEQKVTASAKKVEDLKLEAVVVDKAAAVEVKKSATKRADYHAARAKVEVKGDSVFADGQRLDLPSVAAALVKADTMSLQDSTAIREQARSDTLQHVLVGALDHHVDLLQEEKRPRFGTKTGIAIGVLGTATVIYIGVRIIQALGHK